MKAAIDVLRRELESCLKTRAKNFPILSIEPERSIRQTIALLEAAGGMDKKLCLELTEELEFFLVKKDKRDADFIKANKQIRTLLESLPDKEEKE